MIEKFKYHFQGKMRDRKILILKKKQLTEYFGDNWYGRWRTRMWNFVEYPESSKPAQILAFFSLFMVCVSTITFVIGTNYDEQETESEADMKNTTIGASDENENPVKRVIDVVDNIAVYFFTIEYVARYVFSPCAFSRWLDILLAFKVSFTLYSKLTRSWDFSLSWWPWPSSSTPASSLPASRRERTPSTGPSTAASGGG